jgi:hypothetical protein
MRIYPNIYLRSKGSRFQASSVGLLKEILSSWISIEDLKAGATEEVSPENTEMGDGTNKTTAEAIKHSFSGIQTTAGQYNSISVLLKDKIDVCLFDENEMVYVVLFNCSGSVQKTSESGQSVTFNFTIEKRCTDAGLVTRDKRAEEVYITGIVADESSQPVVGATITCINPVKTGYSVSTDSHGEFALEAKISEAGSVIFHVEKGAETKDITLNNLTKGQIVPDLEVTL